MDAPVIVARDGAIGTVTLNRPAKRNALDTDTIDGLRAAFGEMEREDAIRVVVLTGAGRDFCAGADLAQLRRIADGADALDNVRDAEALGGLLIRMRNLSKPVIAAVRGNAIAGGAGLAGACDIVLAADDAVFGYPEVHLGFVPAMVMALLRRAVGEKVAFELVARGDRITAAEAQRVGLVTRVLDTGSFDDDVARYAGELARRSPSALALTKRLLYGMDGMSFEEAIARGAEVNALARSTDDCREGVRRFLEKQRDT
ncbi:MAG TPA: enoyl-CoA hydratase-related protein [Longimicrobiales bacterium]|nr:enoyl-CoA hydratase-related protein [Longimicrobiales bacterium]